METHHCTLRIHPYFLSSTFYLFKGYIRTVFLTTANISSVVATNMTHHNPTISAICPHFKLLPNLSSFFNFIFNFTVTYLRIVIDLFRGFDTFSTVSMTVYFWIYNSVSPQWSPAIPPYFNSTISSICSERSSLSGLWGLILGLLCNSLWFALQAQHHL